MNALSGLHLQTLLIGGLSGASHNLYRMAKVAQFKCFT